MARMRLLCCIFLLLATLPSAARAGTIVVDPAGGGDYDNIPEAAFYAGADDTVLVMPGTYVVEDGGSPGWPIPLDAGTPTFLSESGAGVTRIEGVTSLAPFSVAAGVTDARLFAHGFTFTNLLEIIHWDYPSYPGGPVRFTDNIVEGNPTAHGTLNAGDGAGGLIAGNVFFGAGSVAIRLGHNGAFAGVVEGNDVSGYYTGIVGAGENTEIRGNHIHNCEDTGIVAYGPLTATDNVIENNAWYGIALEGEFYLEGNVIRGNAHGVGWPFVPIGGLAGYARLNDIYDNGTNMSTPEIMYPWEFDATMNWWGTTDPEEIAEGIWDCNDPLGGFGCVVFTPWCTAPTPGCDPTGVEETPSWGAIKALYR